MVYNKPIYMIMHADIRQDGKWENVGKVFKSALKEMNEQLTDRVCDERNPVLYDVLAGLRAYKYYNYSKITPLRESKELNEKQYVTLQELIDYPWGQDMCLIGYITEKQYNRYCKNGTMPPYTNRNINKDDSIIVSPLEMDIIIQHPEWRNNDKKYFIKFEFDRKPLKELCNFFYNTVIEELIMLLPDGGNANDVRIEYFFA